MSDVSKNVSRKNVSQINKEVDADYLAALHVLDTSNKVSKQKFMGVMGLVIVVFIVIFSILPRLF